MTFPDVDPHDGPLAEPDPPAFPASLLDFRFGPRTPPSVPPGLRVYAIGDVHGQADLFETLLDRIDADDVARGPAETHVVQVGDLIDRGPDSRRVVERAMAGLDWAAMTTLRGNHEQMMLDALDGDRTMLRVWLNAGGDTTLQSWGYTGAVEGVLDADDAAAELVKTANDLIPDATRLWLTQRPLSIGFGDYHFVHAGIRPGIPIARQVERDALWIRRPFLQSDRNHGVVVVHGHTISPEVVVRHNRIGIDTGAYATGRLTALGLEGTSRWTLSARR